MRQFRNYFQEEVVSLAGRNAALAVTLENLYEGSVLLNWSAVGDAAHRLDVIGAAADAAAGTGARTLRIGGLDANYRPLEETITLNGTTPVTTVASFLRVFYAEVLTTGSGLVNAGAINVCKTGTTAGTTHLWVSIPIGLNAATSGLFTVPAGSKYRLESIDVSARTQQVDAYLFSQEPGDAIRRIEDFTIGGPNTAGIKYPRCDGPLFVEKEDIWMRASSATAAGVISMTLQLRREGPGAQY